MNSNNNYAAIDAWDELIEKLYGREGKRRIEIFIERMELGLIGWLPQWTIISGGPATGKSTLIGIIYKMFADNCVPFIEHSPADFGQFNGILGVCHDADILKLYNYVSENWAQSSNYHLLVGTNQIPIPFNIKESHEIIVPTGNRISFNEYKKLMIEISYGIQELKLYFYQKAGSDYIMRKI